MKIRFLGLDEVLAIHRDQVERYGGTDGVRDLGLLESAVAAPEASFDGKYLHETLPAMAAAYLYHLAQNRAFLDGNKRVAAASMFLFLYMNELELDCTEDELVELTVGVASSKVTKAEIAVFLSAHVNRSADPRVARPRTTSPQRTTLRGRPADPRRPRCRPTAG